MRKNRKTQQTVAKRDDEQGEPQTQTPKNQTVNNLKFCIVVVIIMKNENLERLN